MAAIVLDDKDPDEQAARWQCQQQRQPVCVIREQEHERDKHKQRQQGAGQLPYRTLGIGRPELGAMPGPPARLVLPRLHRRGAPIVCSALSRARCIKYCLCQQDPPCACRTSLPSANRLRSVSGVGHCRYAPGELLRQHVAATPQWHQSATRNRTLSCCRSNGRRRGHSRR